MKQGWVVGSGRWVVIGLVIVWQGQSAIKGYSDVI